LALALGLALIDAAVAQTLDLDAAAPAPPPSLGLGTYAADLSRLLKQEMKDIAAAGEGRDPVAQTIALTSIKFRDLAVRLLDGGDDAGQAGSTAVLAGVRLVRGRGEIDALLARVAGPDVLDGPAHAALRRYVEPGHAWSTEPDPDDPGALDAALAEHLEPLALAVRLLVPGETANHWITPSQVRPGPQRPAEPGLGELLGVLVGVADTTELGDEGSVALRQIIEYLQRGASFEQFVPQVREYAMLLTDAMALWTQLDTAAWLSDVQRSTCRAIIIAAIVQVADEQTRAQGVDRLRRLADARRIIRRISQLNDTARAAARGRTRRDAPRIDMEPVTRAFGAVVMAAGDNPGDGSPQVDRLGAILDRMIAYRELSTPALTRELRHAWRKLHHDYERTERGILDALPQLATTPGAMADPALASLVADHRQYLDDLRRLQSLPLWLETIRQAAPRAAGPFGGRLRRLIGDLGAPSRRHAAVQAIDRLDRRMKSYFPMPFEQRLIDGDRAAIIASGGLHEQLAVEIDRQRRAWVAAWGAGMAAESGATGDAGDAGRRLETLHRLTQIMADSARLLEADADAIALDRWAAWELDPATIERIGADLRNRLRLASKAAVDHDDAGLTEQVARVRAGLTALISALLARLEIPVADLPAGPLSIVGQCVVGPTPAAWLLGQRRELADLCRYTMEMEFARTTGRAQLAGSLGAWIDDLASTLMKEISP
jgi:hypothetical protein